MLVTGFGLAHRARPVLDSLVVGGSSVSLLVHTADGGATAAAGVWAGAKGVPVLRVPLRRTWAAADSNPAFAVRERTLRLLTEWRPDIVIAFPSEGVAAADIVFRAQAFGIRCLFAEVLDAQRFD